MGHHDPTRGRPTRTRLPWLVLALALASAAVLAGGVLAEDDGGPQATAAAALKQTQVTIDKTRMVDSAHWTVSESAARWDTSGFTGDYSWTIPSSIPAGGAQGSIKVTSTDKTGGRYNGVISASGAIVEGGSVQAQALADKNGGQATATESKTFDLDPNSCGSSCTVVVGVQDGPKVTFRYEAEADPCPARAAAHTAQSCPTSKEQVTVTSISGEVAYRTAAGDWQILKVGDKLTRNHEIFTGVDSKVTLKLSDGSSFELNELTQILIDTLERAEDRKKIKVQLKVGEIKANFPREKALDTNFEIVPSSTPLPDGGAICSGSVRGTVFSVFYDAVANVAIFTTKKGEVEVDPTAAGLPTRLVTAGKEVEVTRKSISKLAGIGKAGARGGVNRARALDLVAARLADGAKGCKLETPRSPKVFSVKPAPRGWLVSVTVRGKAKGKSTWTVKRGKARPKNRLARKIARGCS